jgi:hypothetical protein
MSDRLRVVYVSVSVFFCIFPIMKIHTCPHRADCLVHARVRGRMHMLSVRVWVGSCHIKVNLNINF